MNQRPHLVDLARRWLWTLSWPAWLGLTAIVGSIVLASLASTWRAEAAQADTTARRVLAASVDNVAQRQAAADPAAAWKALLPSEASRDTRLTDLLELAARHAVAVPLSEQALQPSAPSVLGLQRMQVRMPAVGSYTALRAFVGAALREDDALSLNTLRLSRDSPAADAWQADMVWTLHYQTLAAAPVEGNKVGTP